MPTNAVETPLALHAPDGVRRVREILDRAGYNETRILQLLGTQELPPGGARSQLLPLWRRRTCGGSPLADLLRMFLFHEPIAAESFRHAIEPMEPADWAELGLVQVQADAVVGTVQLLPYGTLIVAADWTGQPATASEHVMAVGGSSRTLADFTVRRPSRRTLDLGCGCGVQSLLAAAHSDEVWAVDRNPRAVHFTAFNALLNGRANIHCLTGDLFEPAAGQVFDLVVANLPFVICPDARYLFCQGGMPGDTFCQTVIRTVPRFLRDGGCCQIVSDVAHVAGQDWKQRVAGWFTGIGCDAWVLYALTLDVAAYAAHWLRETEGPDLDQRSGQFDDWMAYYERERIEAISFALIVLRRSTARKHWFYCEQVAEARLPSGDDIVLAVGLRDFLETMRDDRVLLDAKLMCAPNLRWEQALELAAEGWAMTTSRLRALGGWTSPTDAGAQALFLVARCRGTLRVYDIALAWATATGDDLADALPDFLALVRRLVEQGLLWPAVGS